MANIDIINKQNKVCIIQIKFLKGMIRLKDVILFLVFLLYATAIFFIPNSIFLLIPFIINLLILAISKTNIKRALKNLLKLSPFVLLTFIINCLLDNYINATWMALKLFLVCNITFIYGTNTNTTTIAKTVKKIFTPLKILKVNPEEVEVLVAVALSMLPILKREYLEVKEACKAKNIKFNLKNIKIILSKLLTSFLKKVAEIDEALIEKGYDY